MTIDNRLVRLAAAAMACSSVALAAGATAATTTWASPQATTATNTMAASTNTLHAASTRAGAADGPHSPWGRRPDPTASHRSSGVVISTFDLGDVTLPGSRFRSPARGTLVLPAHGSHLPLVVLLQRRPAGCTHGVHAFPCPAGTRQVRPDILLADEAATIARTGRAVLVPDVAPATVSASPTSPYLRGRAVQAVLSRETTALAQASAGARDTLGQPLAGRVDLHRTSVRTHA